MNTGEMSTPPQIGICFMNRDPANHSATPVQLAGLPEPFCRQRMHNSASLCNFETTDNMDPCEPGTPRPRDSETLFCSLLIMCYEKY